MLSMDGMGANTDEPVTSTGEMQAETAELPSRRVVYVVSDELAKVSSLLPSNRNRSILVHTLISKLGLLAPTLDGKKSPLTPVRPRLATTSELLQYHDADYVAFVLDPRNSARGVPQTGDAHAAYGIEDDCPPFPGLPQYVRLVAGATLTAAHALRAGTAEVAICWDGGRHHAQKARASGFCYVADCVLALLALKRPLPGPHTDPRSPWSSAAPRKPRVLYLDLDVHFCDAVAHAFSGAGAGAAPQVLTLSLHHAAPGFFPPSPLAALPAPSSASFDPFTLALPLRAGASARSIARAWGGVERVAGAFAPDAVVLQCGADGLAGDPLGAWNWAARDARTPGELGWCVRRVLEAWGCRVLLLGGGGYHAPNAARAWAQLTAIAIGRPLPPDTPVPDHGAFPAYAPSFTLDVPAGNMRDENDEAHLCAVERVCDAAAAAIRARMAGA